VRMRLIEFQDWHTPPPSDDDDFYGGGGSNSGNGYWPGLCDSGGAGARRYGGAEDPRLGHGYGPGFMPRQQQRAILVGQFRCPVVSPQASMPCPPVRQLESQAGHNTCRTVLRLRS
jgi:hypothetical protein